MQNSISLAVAVSSRKRGVANDDESSLLENQSVNLLLDNDSVDQNNDRNSQDSEETEVPSQELFRVTSLKVTRNRTADQSGEQQGRPRVSKLPTAREICSSLGSSPSSDVGVKGSPPAMGPITVAAKPAEPQPATLQAPINSDSHYTHTSPPDSELQQAVSPRIDPFQSPTTETVRELSQDIDDLQYHKIPINKKASGIPKTSMITTSSRINNAITTKPPPKASTKKHPRQTKKLKCKMPINPKCSDKADHVQCHVPVDLSREWKVIPIRIPAIERASLGIAIARSTFPGLAPQPSKQHCVVKRIIHQTSSSTAISENQQKEVRPKKKARKDTRVRFPPRCSAPMFYSEFDPNSYYYIRL